MFDLYRTRMTRFFVTYAINVFVEKLGFQCARDYVARDYFAEIFGRRRPDLSLQRHSLGYGNDCSCSLSNMLIVNCNYILLA